jgi:aryl-alcohol dehydrogenase-like predicted oxidoreductase
MLPRIQYGKSGLMVSRLCLGTMNFGIPGHGQHGSWTLPIDEARLIFRAAMDAGLFYFDCANNYGMGACEEVVGELLRESFQRDEYVFSTKLAMPMGEGPNQGGLSRKHILESVDASLRRTGLDYLDQLVIHRHPHTIPNAAHAPLEEMLEALHDVVKAGKALYLGASSMYTWQFVELQMLAQMRGWTPFVSMQNHYNLIYREEEREMHPYCEKTGVAVTPWSPLARGILAGSYQGGLEGGATARSQGRDVERARGLYRGDFIFDVASRAIDVADRLGYRPAQVALAWMLANPVITSPIVGVSRLDQLEQLVAAVDISLPEEDISYLEQLYRPVDNMLDDERPLSVLK